MSRNKKINKNFFKKWTKEMSYILGFFSADGYITINKNGGQYFCFQITDGSLLHKIRDCFDSGHKISKRTGRGNDKDSYRLQVGSFEMCDDLRRLGYRENKTKSLVIPQVPDNFFSDFVLGYFDGDGNVWTGLIHKERKTKSLAISVSFTSCSKNFLSELRDRLELFGILRGIISKRYGNYYRLTYSIKSSLKLFNFMYNGMVSDKKELFLQRKKEVFERFVKMRA